MPSPCHRSTGEYRGPHLSTSLHISTLTLYILPAFGVEPGSGCLQKRRPVKSWNPVVPISIIITATLAVMITVVVTILVILILILSNRFVLHVSPPLITTVSELDGYQVIDVCSDGNSWIDRLMSGWTGRWPDTRMRQAGGCATRTSTRKCLHVLWEQRKRIL